MVPGGGEQRPRCHGWWERDLVGMGATDQLWKGQVERALRFCRRKALGEKIYRLLKKK